MLYHQPYMEPNLWVFLLGELKHRTGPLPPLQGWFHIGDPIRSTSVFQARLFGPAIVLYGASDVSARVHCHLIMSSKNRQMGDPFRLLDCMTVRYKQTGGLFPIRLPHREQQDFALHSGEHTDLSPTCSEERSSAQQADSLYGVRPV